MTKPQQPTIEELRHSTAHILAAAVLELFPDAKLAIGPTIDEGFYYDFDLTAPLTPDDLTQIENRMRRILKTNQEFCHSSLPRDAALALMAEKNQPYKVELIQDLDDQELSFYQVGSFMDLCKGPHVSFTKDIKAFKLLSIAGAYWRGSEKNKMLQRIYGTAFFTQAELDDHIAKIESAKQRDHRLIGKELDLFSTSDEIGGGLVLWHPKGARVRHEIEKFWKDEHFKNGYELLYTPHFGKSNLWETSGHLGFYKDSMYSPMIIDEQEYLVKPMNCPFHIMVYQTKQHSYRNLPYRWAELGTVYRYERSGTLHGLMRVRGFTQDDAHIICTPEQIYTEISKALDFSFFILRAFGFSEFDVYLSTRPEGKCVGEPEKWEEAQNALRQAMGKIGIKYDVDEGGGAFYGPKIDIKIKDAIGRSWQCSTIQFDFNLPERFDMTYIGSDGQKHRPYMVHRALMGSLERFFGVLIEHYEGRFPAWLAPVQVKILAINDDVIDYCKNLIETLQKEGLRTELDDSDEKIGYKIRLGAKEKIPYLLIVGQKEKENQSVAVRQLGAGDLGVMTQADFIAKIKEDILAKQ